jgi:4-amino-4-deoxy-L-arabinose transferase-like glycosyltransferase
VTGSPPAATSSRLAVLGVVLAFALASLPALPDLPLRRASQARAWVVAREMVASGDWVVPSYMGEARLKKPPLQSWVQAAAMEACGSDSLAVAGFGSWLVGLLFALGPLAIGAAAGRPFAGLLGSLLLCATRATLWWGASPEHDVPFAGWVALSLAALCAALGPQGRPRQAWAAGLCCGAAVLVKGPFAVAFVLGTALLAPRRGVGVRRGTLWTALLLGTLAPVGLWLALVTARLGSIGAVLDEVVRQATGAEGAHVKRGVAWAAYYVGMVPKWCMPWTPVVLGGAAWLAWRRRRAGGETVPRGPSSLRFPAVASLVTFAVLTIVPAKQEHYLLPLLPPLFVLAGAVLESVVAALGRRPRALAAGLAAVGSAFGASRLAASAYLATPALLAVEGGFLALLVGIAALGARRLAPGRATVLALLLAAAATGLGARRDALRGRAEEDFRDDGARVEALVPAAGTVVGFAPGSGEAYDVLVAWVRRPYERVREGGSLATLLARREPAVVLVRETDLPALGDLRGELERRFVASPPRATDPKDRVTVFRPRCREGAGAGAPRPRPLPDDRPACRP